VTTGASGPGAGTAARVVRALAGRPDLWWTAAGAVLRLAAPGWWRERPPLPLPAPSLWAFRMETAYGRADVDPEGADVLAYLEWCRSMAGRGRTRGPRPPRGRRGAGRAG
jgi:hypothetical protein